MVFRSISNFKVSLKLDGCKYHRNHYCSATFRNSNVHLEPYSKNYVERKIYTLIKNNKKLPD